MVKKQMPAAVKQQTVSALRACAETVFRFFAILSFFVTHRKKMRIVVQTGAVFCSCELDGMACARSESKYIFEMKTSHLIFGFSHFARDAEMSDDYF